MDKTQKAINYMIEHYSNISIEDVDEITGRSGKDIIWYYDGIKDIALYVDTLRQLTEEEEEEELL